MFGQNKHNAVNMVKKIQNTVDKLVNINSIFWQKKTKPNRQPGKNTVGILVRKINRVYNLVKLKINSIFW